MHTIRLPLARRFQLGAILGTALLALPPLLPATLRGATLTPLGMRLDESVAPVGVSPGEQVVRTTLSAAESSASLDAVISLRMPNFTELQSRIAKGARIARADLEARYLPAQSDYERVASWAASSGLTITQRDKNHTNLFVRATVSQLSRVFGVTFARVSNADGEFTSALTAPVVPSDIAGVLVGVIGLQTHRLMHAAAGRMSVDGTDASGRFTPADILAAYDAPDPSAEVDVNGRAINGYGQTIGIIMDSAPLASDLTTFWQAMGIGDSLSNFTNVPLDGGPQSSNQTSDQNEASIDTEWTSAIAPGANIRLYSVPALSSSYFIAACNQMINDGLETVASYCAGAPESSHTPSELQSASQTVAQLAASGVTVLCASGDGGSNSFPVGSGVGYAATNQLAAEYPASDPNAAGVGGTLMSFDANWNDVGEVAWSRIGTQSTSILATGGGVSGYFSRPSWQAGPGVPVGNNRCVPDVAAIAESDPQAAGSFSGAAVYVNGQLNGFVGTSVSTSIYAGVVAMINQYRVAAGLPNMGVLGPWIYGMIGSSAFIDETYGTNGAYNAGTGYDLCTGVGSPDIAWMILLITEQITDSSPPSGPVGVGTALSMSVTPQFTPSTYQWSLNGTAIAGATAATYSIAGAQLTDAGDYTCTITNALLGALTYDVGTLTVSAALPRLVNISTRAQVGTGGNILIPGFVITGTGTETLLIRADGPALTNFNVSGVLAQPILKVLDSSGNVIATNTGWGTNTDPAAIAVTSAKAGAFALAPASADCAVVVNLSAGAYTVEVSGVNSTTGVALAEIYEVGSTGTRLVNISTRAQVGTGGNILIPGFVIVGSGTESLLVRADGPALKNFNVSGVLQQPTLGVYDSSGNLIASNTGWSSNPNSSEVAATSSFVGAFALASGSSDSAETVALPPGAYTMQISGVNNTTGVALAEVYEIP